MKTIHVVCAVMMKDGKIFATQRGYGEFKDRWEFPGGKIELGETPEQAIIREIHEELNTDIEPQQLLDVVEEDYPDFHISMQCFLCGIRKGSLELLEHESARWLDKEHLYDVAWLPADLDLVKGKIEKMLQKN